MKQRDKYRGLGEYSVQWAHRGGDWSALLTGGGGIAQLHVKGKSGGREGQVGWRALRTAAAGMKERTHRVSQDQLNEV